MSKKRSTTTLNTIFPASRVAKNNVSSAIHEILAKKNRTHYPSFYGTAWHKKEIRNSKCLRGGMNRPSF